MSAEGVRLLGAPTLPVDLHDHDHELATPQGLEPAPATNPHGPRMTARFRVAGWGTALPERRVTNDDLAQRLDTSDEWISSRTGIRERRFGGAGESTGPLAVAAARQALDRAGVAPTDLDLVVVTTATPEQPVPSTAAGVAAALGTPAGAFDVNAACAGFVYGMVIVGGLLQTGVARRVLLVGSDTMSRFVDPTDRSTYVLFGDGAGAVVLDADPTPHATSDDGQVGGLLACDLVDDPEAFDLLVIPAGGSGRPASADTVRAREHYLRMDGREVFRRAVRAVEESIIRTLDRAGCKPDEVDLFIPHQANARIIEAVVARVGLSLDRTIQTVDKHGNTSSASVPLALSEIADAGRLHDGSLILTSGFGAGLTVGTCLLRWQRTTLGSGR
jgi:3-oxoacyl-[acyl-carrier-protein] synthase-3